MGGSLYTVVYLGAIVAFFYFVMIRPQQKKSKELDAMRAGLKIGDEVLTIGGIKGTIAKISDDSVIVKSGDVNIEMAKWGVGSVENNEDENSQDNDKAVKEIAEDAVDETEDK